MTRESVAMGHEVSSRSQPRDNLQPNLYLDSLKAMSGDFLRKCQRNIYSDDEVLTDESGYGDPFYGIYKHTTISYLERKVKDEFKIFTPVSFIDAITDSNIESQKNQQERFENKKEQLIKRLYEQQLQKDLIPPNYPVLNFGQLDREFNEYFKTYEDLSFKKKMSYQYQHMPSNLRPATDVGNYSLLINENKAGIANTKDVREVNEWVRLDMRTSKIAFDQLKYDVRVHSDFDTFDIQDLHCIKYKNDVN